MRAAMALFFAALTVGPAGAVPLFDLLQVWGRTMRLQYGYTMTGSLNLAPPIFEATTLRAP